MQHKKLPLGLKPEFIFNEQKNFQRIGDICEAISRYKKHKKPIPLKWLKELKKRLTNV